MRILFVGMIASLACFASFTPCMAQGKAKEGKTASSKDAYVGEGGVRVRAMLPEPFFESMSSAGHITQASGGFMSKEQQRITLFIPISRPFDKTPAITIPEKDPEGKFVEEYLTSNVKDSGIKYDSITKVEQNGYIGREAYLKPQMGKDFMGKPYKFGGRAVRMFVVNKALASVEITWEEKEPSKESIKKLFDSFKIEKMEKVDFLNGR